VDELRKATGLSVKEDQVCREGCITMKTRYFALIVGIIFLLVGIMGFVPSLRSLPNNGLPITVTSGYGYELGLFPINVLHNIVHLTVGALGIAAFWSFSFARLFARGLAIFYGLLAVMGLIPATSTTFGLIPIFGNDVWLHAVTALISGYFGYAVSENMEEADSRIA
jgi:hypothetical protein